MTTIRDTWLIFRRSMILTFRQPVWIFMGLMQPILYLVLFGPLLNGAVKASGATDQRLQLVRPRPAHPGRHVRRRVRRASASSPSCATASSSGCG